MLSGVASAGPAPQDPKTTTGTPTPGAKAGKSAPTATTPKPTSAAQALVLAESAFEYRDFKLVVQVLGPWLNPPRILDEKLLIKAHKLMGISRHVLGSTEEAKGEFGRLLRLSPKHKLDAFVVPPNIIATFEAVRVEMKDVLEAILKQRGEGPTKVEPPKPVELVMLPDRWITFLPAGVPQFALDQTTWGVLWGSLQVLGLATNISAFFLARDRLVADENNNVLLPPSEFLVAQYVGAGVALTAYVISVVQGNLQLSSRVAELKKRGPVPEETETTSSLRFAPTLGVAPDARGGVRAWAGGQLSF